MRVGSVRSVPDKCLWYALLFCTVYSSYRYPLQYNFSGTSPTYSDTPLAFQLGKFFVVFSVSLISAGYVLSKKTSYGKWMMVVCIAGSSAYALFKSLGSEDHSQFIEAAFWQLAMLVLVLPASTISPARLNKYFVFVYVYAVVSTAVELFLLLAFGRLPALAYAGTFFIRFGGFLDDPNAFAAILYMLGGWAHYRFDGGRRFFLQLALFVCILLTQSLTAGAFLILVALVYLWHLVRKGHWIGAGLAAASLAAVGWMLQAFASPLLSQLAEARTGSVNDHLSQVAGFSTRSVPAIFLGNLSFEHFESWWLSAFSNFGLFWFIQNVTIIIALTYVSLRRFRCAKRRDEKAVLGGIMGLSFYFVIGNVNLPLFLIFPVNALFFLLSYLVYFGKIENDAPPLRRTALLSGADVNQ